MKCFLFAIEEEINVIRKKIPLTKLTYKGITCYYNDNLVLGLTQIGKVNASINLSFILNRFDIDEIINIGIGGAYQKLKQGDFLISDKVIYHDFDLTWFNYEKGEVPGGYKYFLANETLKNRFIDIFNKMNEKHFVGNIASGDKFILKKEEICLPYEIYGVDMESGGIAQVASVYGVNFVCIKLISDCLGEKSPLSYNEFEKKCGYKISDVVLKYLEVY